MVKPDAQGKRSVILDSNFLFIPLKFGVDIFEELERLFEGPVKCILPSFIVDELNRLRADAKPSMIRQIDFALSLTKDCEKVEVEVKMGQTVDDHIVELAKSLKLPVATNDTILRRRLRVEGIPVIYLRQKTHLELTCR